MVMCKTEDTFVLPQDYTLRTRPDSKVICDISVGFAFGLCWYDLHAVLFVCAVPLLCQELCRCVRPRGGQLCRSANRQ
jgi:hypothetical protein